MGIPDLYCPTCYCTPDEIGDAGLPATWRDVQELNEANCAVGYCHYPGVEIPGGPGLDLGHGHAYQNMLPILTPYDLNSYLYIKLTVDYTQQWNPKGHRMPVGEPFDVPLDDCQIDIVRRWILAGAPGP
jgi:hypothetical protein